MAKAAGAGHRWVAAMLGVPVSTVRGWLRRFDVNAEMVRVWFTVLAHGLDPMLGPICPTGTAVGDAVEAIGVAARAAVQRFGPLPVWARVARLSGGALLCHTSCPLPAPPGV